tara:strand:+ start:63 stop:323 length:261 start_codon:yes stop_codon:yes gene_type:complete
MSQEGLYYTENEESKLIPRCEEQDKHCYKYSEDDLQYKIYLLKECSDMYPDVDKHMIEIYVDFYMNHPEKFKANIKNDSKIRKQLK